MTQGNTSLVTGLTFVATLGGLLFGYDTVHISVASPPDANFIDLTSFGSRLREAACRAGPYRARCSDDHRAGHCRMDLQCDRPQRRHAGC